MNPFVDEIELFRLAVQCLSLIYPVEIVGHYSSGCVIEIYNRDLCQIYRSFAGFAFCNYSLMELADTPWLDLYEMDAGVAAHLAGAFREAFDGPACLLNLADRIPPYTMRERLTKERDRYLVRDRAMARAKSTLNGATFLIVLREIQAAP